MEKLQFDYEDWTVKDKTLDRPGNVLGYTAIITSLDVGDTPTVRGRQQDALLRETEAGVIGLLAGAIEWLRWRGYSAATVQSKVNAYKRGNRETPSQRILKEAQEEIEGISNPRRRKLGTVVIG